MEYVSKESVIEALNECVDIKGFAYTSLHDAIMEMPTITIKDGDDNEQHEL